MEQLVLNPNTLVAFVDDTGHEGFPEGHNIYGLGGCAIQAGNLDHLLRRPWHLVRKHLLGDPRAPLHASEITKKIPREKQAVVGQFFESFPFMRFAVVATVKTRIPDPLVLLDAIAPILVKRLLEIMNRTDAPGLTVIFESSERANSIIERHFSAITINESGANVPIEWGFMPKSVGEPALEVADFIMHSVHGLAYDELAGCNGYQRRDFRSVFQRKNPNLSSFMLMEAVIANTPEVAQPVS